MATKAPTEQHDAETTEQLELQSGRRAPFTMAPDWVLLAPVSRDAKILYWALAGHVNQQRGDNDVWPTQKHLATIVGYTNPKNVRERMQELVSINAIEIRKVRTHGGMRPRSIYTVHQTPPDGWGHPTSLQSFYQGLKEFSQVTPNDPHGTPSKGTAQSPSKDPHRGSSNDPHGGQEPYEVELDEVKPDQPSTTLTRDEVPSEPSPTAEQCMDGGVSDDGKTKPETSALDLIQSVIPHGHGGYNAKSHHDHAVAAVVASREVLTDAEIKQVLGYGLDAVRNPAALIRTHRTAELLAVVKKREGQAKHPPRADAVPALWCTDCVGVAVVVTTAEGTRSKLRCSHECSKPRQVDPWVWGHVTDKRAVGAEGVRGDTDDGSGAYDPSDGVSDARPTFQRPSQRVGDGDAERERRRSVNRFAQQFGGA